jgi:hypothetical protein
MDSETELQLLAFDEQVSADRRTEGAVTPHQGAATRHQMGATAGIPKRG